MDKATVWHPVEIDGKKGVRYRKHPTRRHGVQYDKYFAITYWWQAKTVSEGVGWASDGTTASGAFAKLKQLRENQKAGTPPFTLKEWRQMEADEREAEKQRREAEEAAAAIAERQAVTFEQFFTHSYLPAQDGNKKQITIKNEKSLFKKHLKPIIGAKRLLDVSPFDFERVRSVLKNTGRSPRTAQYVLALARQVLNRAILEGAFTGENPVVRAMKTTKAKPFDNKRVRFLTPDEAEKLLAAVRKKSERTYEIATLSLYGGLRAGEVFSLTWGDIDLARGILTLRDTKSGETRQAFITERMRQVLETKQPGKPSELVYPDRKGRKASQVPRSFRKVVDDLGLNEGVEDRRQRVCFHTLRHTFASWLVERGTDIYQVQKLLGHSSLSLTERYSHLSPTTLQAAVRVLDESKVIDSAERSDAQVVNLEERT